MPWNRGYHSEPTKCGRPGGSAPGASEATGPSLSPSPPWSSDRLPCSSLLWCWGSWGTPHLPTALRMVPKPSRCSHSCSCPAMVRSLPASLLLIHSHWHTELPRNQPCLHLVSAQPRLVAWCCPGVGQSIPNPPPEVLVPSIPLYPLILLTDLGRIILFPC